MGPLLFDWRFWFVLIVIVIVIRWLVVRGDMFNQNNIVENNENKNLEEVKNVEEKCDINPEIAPIVHSWIPPPHSRGDRIVGPSPVEDFKFQYENNFSPPIESVPLVLLEENLPISQSLSNESNSPERVELSPNENKNPIIEDNSGLNIEEEVNPNLSEELSLREGENILLEEDKKIHYSRAESPICSIQYHNSITTPSRRESIPLSPIPEEPSYVSDRDKNISIRIIKRKDKKSGRKTSVGEQLTCKAFKELLQDRDIVNNYRPNFLTNPSTGYPMEIDCYCHELGCGVEYNGIQHYQYPNPFSLTEEDFDKQVERDRLKRELADLNNTPIFTVPCTVDAVIYNERQEKYVSVRRSKEARYELIYAYLKEQMASFLEEKGIIVSSDVLS
jgi:hypothetical protein